MNRLALLLVILAAALQPARAQIITNFGTSQFTITYSDFTTTQTTNSLKIVGSDFGSIVSGTIPSIVIPPSAVQLTLTGTLAGTNPGSTFQIALLDNADNAVYYNGAWTSFTIGVPASVVLTREEAVPGFTGNIVRVALFTGGTGNTIDFTMTQLSVVPEPGTAVLFGLSAAGVLGFVRRRRVVG